MIHKFKHSADVYMSNMFFVKMNRRYQNNISFLVRDTSKNTNRGEKSIMQKLKNNIICQVAVWIGKAKKKSYETCICV